MCASEEPIPWDAPSRLGTAGRLLRRASRRATRPLEVRLLAREQRFQETLGERLDALERRLLDNVVAGGHQVGWAAGELGRRIDALENRLDRANALAQPTLGADPLRPGTRTAHRCARAPHRRAICSLATGPYIELLDIAGRSFLSYARTWEWDLVVSTEDLSEGRPAPWAKIRFVADLLDEYEWVLWIDADAAFVDLSGNIAAEQEPDKDLYLVEHRWGTRGESTANSGVFMIRASDWSQNLLAHVWDREDLIDHHWWENAALLEALGYRLNPAGLAAPSPALEKVKFLDLSWNSVLADRSPSPFINHHGGGRPIDELRDALLDDAVTLRRASRGTAWRTPRGQAVTDADVSTAHALVDALRFRTQLPDALNELDLCGRGAEVGVRKGEFSEWLLSHWRGSQLLSIDPWRAADGEDYRDIANVSRDDHERFRSEAEGRLLRFGSRSLIWRLTSREAAARVEPASLDFVYLDARHDEASVREDLVLWWPKIVPGGILAGHDYLDGELPAGTFGVRSAVDTFAAQHRSMVYVTTGDWPWPSWVVIVER